MKQDSNPNAMLRSLRQHALTAPTSSSAESALNATRNALLQHRIQRRHAMRRKLTLICSAIAATLAIGISVWTFVVPKHQASAAEMLAEIVRENEAYRGWVRIRTDYGNNDTHTLYKDTSGEKSAWVRERDGKILAINFRDLTHNSHVAFLGETNQIFLGTITDEMADSYRQNRQSVRLDDKLEDLKRPDYKIVSESLEHGVRRFDFEWTVNTFLPSTRPATTPSKISTRMSLFADAQTNLIQKIVYNDKQVFEYTHHVEPINDVYQLGAPRDAAIVDHRVSKEAIDVVQRIQKKVDAGLGRYVAIVTMEKTSSRSSKQSRQLEIYASGNLGEVKQSYNVVDGEAGPGEIRLEDLKGWPKPAYDEVMQAIASKFPYYSEVLARELGGWTTSFRKQNSDGSFSLATTPQAGAYPYKSRYDPASRGLESLIIPEVSRNTEFGPYGTVTVERVENHPEMISLRSSFLNDSSGDGPTKSDSIWYRREHERLIDTSRDDLVTSFVQQSFVADQVKPETTETFQFENFAQTPAGYWYPTTATQLIKREGPDASSESVTHFEIQIHTDRKPDPKWFIKPEE